ncbi:zeta toxin family protein [Streptomyces triculaminicus]|uniref:zeta toxin family protein n=1 Tax=Streptomyces triculaminicus TaxID=2816232 RepID=UPI0037CEA216
MTDPEAARYLLPEEENRRIFRARIVPQLLAGRDQRDVPTVVFLVGQPGAGKSRVTAMVAEVLNKRGGFIDVDSDLYKPFHPEYDRLMQQDDKLMAAMTRADGRRWMAQAHEYVRDNKINAVIQETSQDGAAVAATMQAYRGAGFRVEVMAMGVSAAMSNQGIISRYFEQVRDRGQGRLTVQANADQSYTGILDLADRIDADRLAHETGVYRRGEGTPRYSNALDAAGQWAQPPAMRAAIETERGRPWTNQECMDFLTAHQELRQGLGVEWTERLDVVLDQARPLMSPPAREAADRIVESAAAAALAAEGFPGTVSERLSANRQTQPEQGVDRPQGKTADGPEQGR